MVTDVEEFLAHYGVKGMKWGVRKDRRGGVSRRTDREARKDAQESARAKMFYGEGAGTRRKLIRESVAAKKKRDKSYAEAFDRHLNNQDMSRHANKARSERKSTDRKIKTKQRAGYVARSVTGEMGTQAAFVALTFAGAAYLRSENGQRAMRNAGSRVASAANAYKQKQGAAYIADYLKRNS